MARRPPNPEADLRPTGAPQPSAAERKTQRRLDHALHTSQAGIREWLSKITTAAPACAGDPGLPTLASHLAHTSQRRPRLDALLTIAAGLGPLPIDHPADALHYRVTTLIQQQVEMEYHEALTITQAHRPMSEPPLRTDPTEAATATSGSDTPSKGTAMAIHPNWNQPLPEWLSLQQAAALYGVSVDTLRRRIAAGRLPASRFGERLIRVRSEDLDRLFRPIPTGLTFTRRRA